MLHLPPVIFWNSRLKLCIIFRNSTPDLWLELPFMVMDCHISELQTGIMTQTTIYVCRLTLCLQTNNMPTYSHTHMITYRIVHFQAPEIKLLCPDYYLPDLHFMFPWTMTLPTATICITQNSEIPGLHHILRYINCSTPCTFASLNINLDSSTH